MTQFTYQVGIKLILIKGRAMSTATVLSVLVFSVNLNLYLNDSESLKSSLSSLCQ